MGQLKNKLTSEDDKSSFIDFVEKRVNKRMDIKSSTILLFSPSLCVIMPTRML